MWLQLVCIPRARDFYIALGLWRRDWENISNKLAQGRCSWDVSFWDVVNSINDADSNMKCQLLWNVRKHFLVCGFHYIKVFFLCSTFLFISLTIKHCIRKPKVPPPNTFSWMVGMFILRPLMNFGYLLMILLAVSLKNIAVKRLVLPKSASSYFYSFNFNNHLQMVQNLTSEQTQVMMCCSKKRQRYISYWLRHSSMGYS